MRAASSDWIDSGTGRSAPGRSLIAPSASTSRSRSRSRRTNSSANSGLPAARSRTASSRLGAIACASRSVRSRCSVAPPGSGWRSIRTAFARAAEFGPPLGQFRPRRAEDEHRYRRVLASKVLEEREQRIIGPVEVLEDEDGRPLLREHLEEPAPGSEQLISLAPRSGLDAEQREQTLSEPGLLLAGGQDLSSLAVATDGCPTRGFPACALTISPSAQNAIPEPYGRHRPWRHVMRTGSEST